MHFVIQNFVVLFRPIVSFAPLLAIDKFRVLTRLVSLTRVVDNTMFSMNPSEFPVLSWKFP